MRDLLRPSRSGSTDRGRARTWRRRAVCCIALALAVGQSPAYAERVALVIGNAEYAEAAARLTNPVRDARSMAAMLADLGFAVTRRENANREEMDEAVDAFIGRVRSGDTAVFYYSGHGIELDGENYVLEWTEDCRHETYRGAPRDGSAWTRCGFFGPRVLRGGSWRNTPQRRRSADRTGRTTGFRVEDAGFRVSRTLG